MSAPAEDSFDPAELTQALFGTWSFPNREEPTGRSYLHFSEEGCVFQFVPSTNGSAERITLHYWYTVESPRALRLRANPGEDGWITGFSYEDGSLTLCNPTGLLLCLRLAPEETPAWLPMSLAAAQK